MIYSIQTFMIQNFILFHLKSSQWISSFSFNAPFSHKHHIRWFDETDTDSSIHIGEYRRGNSRLYARGSSFNSVERNRKKDVVLPLYDLTRFSSEVSDEKLDSDNDDDDIPLAPIPSSHLPLDISTLNIYGVQFVSPSHVRMMQEAIERRGGSYGHVVQRRQGLEDNEDDSVGLIGAIGCAVDIVSFNYDSDEDMMGSSEIGTNTQSSSATAAIRGSFRFVVKEVISTIPYPVAIVDELMDDAPYGEVLEFGSWGEGENDEEDEDIYANISPDELPSRCLKAMDSLVKMKLEDKPERTPLENMILESQGQETATATAENYASEELAAVFNVFRQELVEFNDRTFRCFAIGMMAVEVGELNKKDRIKALASTSGVERLKLVLRVMESKISMARAKKMAEQLTKPDEDEMQLSVGKPSMPPWIKSIQIGSKVEYFWNEIEGWCAGTVTERLDLDFEILLSIKFDDDGSVHRIPFTAEEKIRWRPL